MTTRKLRIVVEGRDDASPALRSVGGALGNIATVAGGMLAAQLFSRVASGIASVGRAALDMVIDAAPMETVERTFTNLVEATGRGADEMLASFKDFTSGMVDNRKAMETYNLATQLVGENFANQLPEAMGFLTKVAAATGEDVGFMLDSLVRGVGRLSPMILDNLGIQVALSEATDKASAMFGVQTTELTKAQTQAGMMAVVMEKLRENTASMPDVAGTAAQKIDSMKATFADVKDELGMALLPALSELLGVFNSLWVLYGPAIIRLFKDELAPAINRLARGFGPLMVQAIMFIRDVAVPWVKQHLPQLKAAFLGLAALLTGGAVAVAIGVLISLFALILSPVALVIGAVAALGVAWSSNFLGIRDKTMAVIDAVRPAFKKFVAGLLTAFDWFKGQFEKIFAAFRLAFQGDFRGFGEKLRELWDEAWEKIKEVGKKAWDSIRSFFENTDWGQVGTGILEGIAKGITGGLKLIRDAAVAAAKAALEAAKGFLGIDSPSKAFEKLYAAVPEGAAKGIEGGIGRVTGASRSMAAGALGAGPGGSGHVVHITIEGASDPREVARQVARELRLQGVSL